MKPLSSRKSPRNGSRFSTELARPGHYDGLTGRGAIEASRIQCRTHQEDVVKELSLEEVLRIAGGLPLSAALDELTYRAPTETSNDPIDYAHLVGASRHPSQTA